MSKLTAAYIAGFVDGEGYLGIVKQRHSDRHCQYRSVIGVTSTDKAIIDWFKSSFGGFIGTQEANEIKNLKARYEWKMMDSTLQLFLLKIMPYLKIKKERAIILNQSINHILKYKKAKNGRNRTPEYWKEREEFYQKLKTLNHRGLLHVERLSEATPNGEAIV